MVLCTFKHNTEPFNFFIGGFIMVKYPTILKLPQEDINRQLYEMIVKLQKGEGADAADISDLEDALTALTARVKALEDAD